MRNFLEKEIKLCLSPVNYLFLLFAVMVIIPSYPLYVSFFYFCLSVFFIFNNSELNKDIAYSMILPITKKEIVKSRCVLVCSYEVVCILLTIPFAILSRKLVSSGNSAGIDMNPAFYGLVMLPLTIFNMIFITQYYKKAEKPGLPFLFASIGFWLCYGILEFPVWTKNDLNLDFVKYFDTTEFIPNIQLPVLFGGIAIYILGWILTYKISSSRFEKVDL